MRIDADGLHTHGVHIKVIRRGIKEAGTVSTGKDKIGFIAVARCIGILLVVFGHSYPFDVYIPPVLVKLNQFIYTFHMPLFLFLSGYLVTRNRRSAGLYIQCRAVRLLVPYFSLSIIAFVPKALVQRFLNDSVEFSAWYLIKTELIPRDNVWGHFWYIPVVFFLCCFGVLMQNAMRKSRTFRVTSLIVAYSLLFIPETTGWFALEDLRKSTFYFVLGMSMADFDPEAKTILSPFWILAFPGAIALFGVANGAAGNSVIACLMIGFTLHIGTYLRLDDVRLFDTIEKNSFSIYLLSWPAQAVLEVLCNKILHLPVLLTMGMMFFGGILVPLICVRIVSWLEKRLSMKWVKVIIGM